MNQKAGQLRIEIKICGLRIEIKICGEVLDPPSQQACRKESRLNTLHPEFCLAACEDKIMLESLLNLIS